MGEYQRKPHLEIDGDRFDIPDFIRTDRDLQTYFSGMLTARDGDNRDCLYRHGLTVSEQDIYDVGWYSWFSRNSIFGDYFNMLIRRINARL